MPASPMRLNTLQLLVYASLASGGVVMPLFAAQLGSSVEFIGWIGAAFGLASFASNIVFGRLGDVLDRRRILQWGFLVNALVLALQAFAPTPETFLLARFLAGFVLGIIPATLAAYVYEVRRPLGKFTSFNAMGWLLASLLVVGMGNLATTTLTPPAWEAARVWLVSDVGVYEAIFLAGSLLCLVGLWLSFRVPPMKVALQVPLFPREILGKNLHVYAAVFLRHLGAAGIWTIFPLYIVVELGGSLAMVGWLHVVNMLTQIVVLRRVEAWGRLGSPRWLIGIGLVASALTFWGFSTAEDATDLLPLQVPLGISFACLWLGSLKEVMERSVERATATGLLNASLNLSNVAGPILGGFIAAAYGFRATMLAGVATTVLGFVVYYAMERRRPAAARPTPAVTAGPTGDVAP